MIKFQLLNQGLVIYYSVSPLAIPFSSSSSCQMILTFSLLITCYPYLPLCFCICCSVPPRSLLSTCSSVPKDVLNALWSGSLILNKVGINDTQALMCSRNSFIHITRISDQWHVLEDIARSEEWMLWLRQEEVKIPKMPYRINLMSTWKPFLTLMVWKIFFLWLLPTLYYLHHMNDSSLWSALRWLLDSWTV